MLLLTIMKCIKQTACVILQQTLFLPENGPPCENDPDAISRMLQG